MFLYGSTLPENPTFAPNPRAAAEADRAAGQLWDAERDLMLYRDNANAFEAARAEAYERRNTAIFEATGRQLENPYRASRAALDKSLQVTGATSTYELLQRRQKSFADWRGDLEREWQAEIAQLGKEFPQHADVLGGSIDEDAYRVAREAEAASGAVGAEADAAGVGGIRAFLNRAGGSIAGMARDPLQAAALLAGGGPSVPAKFALGRIASTMLTEAVVNGGVEATVQAASQDWRRKAGVESGLAPALKQVGIAALFGAGAGGLLQGGVEAFRALGRVAPEEALARVAAGAPQPGDMAAIGAALGRPADDELVRAAEVAAEQPALDRAAFGGAIDTPEGERLAAELVRDAENPVDLPPTVAEAEERFRQAERIARAQSPIGRNPRKPQSLVQFLEARGGVLDDRGELAAIGGGRLSRDRSGRGRPDNRVSLDYAREAAEEAGYIGVADGYQTTSVRDLLDAIDQELRGDPVFSRVDGQAVADRRAHEDAVRGRDEYRRAVGRVDSVREELGYEPLDDAVLIRATELVDDEIDEAAALEQAIAEDYRSYSDRAGPVEISDADDIPFFDRAPADDAGAVRPDGGEAGATGVGGDGPGGQGGSQPPGEQFPRAGGLQAEVQPLRAAGDTPEPATPEAGEAAALALTEARGASEKTLSEKTGAGEQTLIPGVKPVSTKEKLEAEGGKPMRGGDAAPPAGGLFDLEARDQLDIWDVMPATRTPDGKTLYTTHADMTAEAERTEFFSDLIKSCKD